METGSSKFFCVYQLLLYIYKYSWVAHAYMGAKVKALFIQLLMHKAKTLLENSRVYSKRRRRITMCPGARAGGGNSGRRGDRLAHRIDLTLLPAVSLPHWCAVSV